MNEPEITRQLDGIRFDFGEESSVATIIILRDRKVFKSLTLEDGVTLIGRHPDCTIALSTDTESSRQHAQIRTVTTPRGSRHYLLMDLGSTNGTILNGDRLDPKREVLLSDGDKFMIGQHLFKFALLDQSNEKFLSGNLTQINLFDLVQIIENNRLTCILTTRSQGMTGRLYFNEGQIADCEVEELRALNAFRKIVTFEEGFFEVEKCSQSFPANIEAGGNMNLMLDTLRELDEERAGFTDDEGAVLAGDEATDEVVHHALAETTVRAQAIQPPVAQTDEPG